MSKEEIIQNIEELFKAWYYKTMFDSTGIAGLKEKEVLTDFCKEHIEEFKEFAQDTLEHPNECCISVAQLCDELLSDELSENERFSWIDKLLKLSKQPESIIYHSAEWSLFNQCNVWLNHFRGTEKVDYYEDYIKYKDYLNEHYIAWNPFKEDDPNPSYKDFIDNTENYNV